MREFQEKLEQLMELAAKQEKNLNNEQILEIFGLNQLSPQQLQSLYEYLRIQGIRIQGADLAPMDIGKALDPQEEQEEEKKPVILEAEDEQCLKEYEEMLRQFPSEKEGEREALLLQADRCGRCAGASGTVVSEGDLAVCEKAVETGDLYW